MLVAVVLQSLGRIAFLRVSGRIGQDVLLELRRRVFTHFQRLDVAFHDRFTSGRVTSRLTSDIDAITELLVGGFDGLVTAVLTMVGVAVADDQPGRQARAGLPRSASRCCCCWCAGSRAARPMVYRRVRELSALVIVQFVETMTGIRAVQAYRREGAQLRDLRRDRRPLQGREHRLVPAGRGVHAGRPADRQHHHRRRAAVRRLRALEGDITIGVLTAFLLYLRMFFEPMQDISQFFNTFQSASSALEKLSGVLEEQPGVVEPTRPGAAAARAGRGALRRRRLRLRPGAPGHLRARADAARGRDGRRRRHHGCGQDDAWPSCWPGSTTRRRAGSRSTASTCATSPTPTCAVRW